MTRPVRPPHLALLLVALLSGCTDAPAAEPEEDRQRPEAGTVLGVVVDGSLRPVPDAHVRVPAAARNATSDDNGAYLLHLPAGSHVLEVHADGFVPKVQSLTVHAGARTDLNTTLERLPPPPRVEVQDFQGFIQCDAIVQPGHSHGDNHTHNNRRCDAVLGADRHTWDLPVRPGSDGMVVELAWEPEQELARFLYVRVEAADGTILADTESDSPLRLQVAQSQMHQSLPAGGTLRVIALVGTGEDTGGNDLGVAWQFQQEFEAFASIFYGRPPGPTYSLLRQP